VYSNEDFDYTTLRNRGTGGREAPENYKLVVYPFGRYLITIKLSLNNEFIGIEEVKVNKDFLSYKQKIPSKGFHDVEEFYRE
jgi:hypothetical protein